MGGRGGFGKENNVRLPYGVAQIKHIFRDEDGHITDLPENRSLLINTASDELNFVGIDRLKNRWYSRDLDGGKQVWVKVRNGIIQNGGVNLTPVNREEKGIIK